MSDTDIMMVIGYTGAIVSLTPIAVGMIFCVVTNASLTTMRKFEKHIMKPAVVYGLGGSLAVPVTLALMRCFL